MTQTLIFTETADALWRRKKSETRRVVTKENTYFDGDEWPDDMAFDWNAAWVDPGPSPAGNAGPYLKLPTADYNEENGTVHRVYSKICSGDLVLVREPFRFLKQHDRRKPSAIVEDGHPTVRFEANGLWINTTVDDRDPEPGKYRNARFMPHSLSRMTLSVRSIGFQRVQDMTAEDAVCEGMESEDPLAQFIETWDSINKDLGNGWDVNPWVAVTRFIVARKNIALVS